MTEEESKDDSVDNSVSITRQKIIYVGDAGVGKTSILNRIMNNPFSEAYENSIGVDFMTKNINYHGKAVKLQIWDSAGQEKYRGLIPSYIRNASIVFLVYDICSKKSFDNVPKWITFIKSIENTAIVLCGNKIDLENREVKKEEGEELARKEGIPFFEVSAKTDENIKNMFYNSIADLPIFVENNANKENLVKELLQENTGEVIESGNEMNQAPPAPITKGATTLQTTNNTTKKKGCHC
jgi:Ras-related protein Rab-6A